MQTVTAGREYTIAEVMKDDPALSRAEAEALYEEATETSGTIASRFAALGIVLPVREQQGEGGAGEIIDANGASLLQVDPLGIREDADVSAIAALVITSINLSADALMEGQAIG